MDEHAWNHKMTAARRHAREQGSKTLRGRPARRLPVQRRGLALRDPARSRQRSPGAQLPWSAVSAPAVEQLVGAELLEHLLERTLTTLTNWYAEQAALEHEYFTERRETAAKLAGNMGSELAQGPPQLVPLGAGEVDGIAFVWPLVAKP